MIDFKFPALGATGKGDPVLPPGWTEADRKQRWHERPIYWIDENHDGYWVTYQLDRPACAFRCHYPGGSAPCNQRTADRFVEWVKNQ